MKKNKHKYTLEKYIEISKTDIIVYLIVFIIITGGILFYLYKTSFELWYFYIFPEIIPLILLIGRIQAFHNLKKIKKHIDDNNLKYKELIYWNELRYFLTDEFMIIKEKNIIIDFKYSEIKEIYYKESKAKFNLGSIKNVQYEEYLHIVLNDNRDYKILIDDMNTIRVEELNDISEYLLEKNKNIKVTEKNKIIHF